MKKPSQANRLLKLLSDGKPHSTAEIQEVVYGRNHLGNCRIGARVADLKARGYEIPDAVRDRENPTLFWYQMSLTGPAKPKPRIEWVEVNGVMCARAIPGDSHVDVAAQMLR